MPSKLLSSQSIYFLMPEDIMEFKKYASYYLKGPIGKWKERRRYPIKILVQFIKVILVTTQIFIYGQYSLGTVSTYSLDRIFIKNYKSQPIEDTNVNYVTNIEEMVASLDFIINRYLNLSKSVLNTYYPSSYNDTHYCAIQICHHHYDHHILPAPRRFGLDYSHFTKTKQNCMDMNFSLNTDSYEINNSYANNDIYQNSFKVWVTLTLFSIIGLDYGEIKHLVGRDLIYNIEFNSGYMAGIYEISTSAHYLKPIVKENYSETVKISVSCLVIVFSLVSAITCVRSMVKSFLLAKMTQNYYIQVYEEALSVSELSIYLDGWNLFIFCTDISNIVVTVISLILSREIFFYHLGIAYGINILFIWIGVLRYLRFFSGFNIILMTLRVSSLTIIRFMSCVIVIFMGFVFSGWIALHYYNSRFETIYLSAKTLFAIMNGDELLATLTNTDPIMAIFSDIYQITFVSFFIYVVLSLFTSIFVKHYEASTEFCSSANTLNRVTKFINGHN